MKRISTTRLIMLRRIVLCSVIAILITLPSFLSAESVDLVLLHMNDTHGTFSSTPDSIKQKENIGSMSRLASVLREIQQENKGRVLTLHVGDLFSKAEPVTIHTGGEISMDIIEKLHVDVLVPGNGEFYFGLSNLIKQTERFSGQTLVANIKLRKTQEPVFKPYTIIEIQGIRIGIVGLGFIYPTHYSSKPLLFENPVNIGNEQAKALRDDVDLLIALTHIGHRWDIQLAKEVPEFDIIIGGHSHTVLNEPVLVPRVQDDGNVIILQAGDYWRFLGRADIRMEKVDDRFTATGIKAKLITIAETVEPDPELEAFLQAAREPFDEIIAQKQSACDKNTMLQLILKATKKYISADIVILDNDIVQAALPKGPVTMGDIYRVHPWRNQILKTVITGKELASILPRIAKNKKVILSEAAPSDNAEGGSFLIDGEKIVQDRMYVMAVADFTISQCPAITSLAFTNTGQRIDSILLNHFRAKSQTQGSNPEE